MAYPTKKSTVYRNKIAFLRFYIIDDEEVSRWCWTWSARIYET